MQLGLQVEALRRQGVPYLELSASIVREDNSVEGAVNV